MAVVVCRGLIGGQRVTRNLQLHTDGHIGGIGNRIGRHQVRERDPQAVGHHVGVVTALDCVDPIGGNPLQLGSEDLRSIFFGSSLIQWLFRELEWGMSLRSRDRQFLPDLQVIAVIKAVGLPKIGCLDAMAFGDLCQCLVRGDFMNALRGCFGRSG